MSKKLQLSIPTPCHENWNNMTKVEKGKFCGSCQKQVIDFSNMSDREIATFFKKKSTGSVCGRFMEDQLDRSIEMPRKRIPWVRYFFQILIPGFLVSCGARTLGKIKVSETKNGVVTKSTCTPTVGVVMMEPELISLTDTTENIIVGDIEINDLPEIDTNKSFKEERVMNDTDILTIIPVQGEVIHRIVSEFTEPLNIKGNVIDDSDQPIPNASILIKGSHNGTASGQNGSFFIKTETSETSVLVVSSVGFESKEIELKDYNLSDSLVIRLKSTTSTLGEVVVTDYGSTKCHHTTGAVAIVTQSYKEDNALTNIQPVKFKIFPNPVYSNSSLNIEWNQSESGAHVLQLLNVSGQLTFSKETWIDDETRVLNLQLPSVAAGNYFLRMTNKKSGKSYTEKIIIQ